MRLTVTPEQWIYLQFLFTGVRALPNGQGDYVIACSYEALPILKKALRDM